MTTRYEEMAAHGSPRRPTEAYASSHMGGKSLKCIKCGAWRRVADARNIGLRYIPSGTLDMDTSPKHAYAPAILIHFLSCNFLHALRTPALAVVSILMRIELPLLVNVLPAEAPFRYFEILRNKRTPPLPRHRAQKYYEL